MLLAGSVRKLLKKAMRWIGRKRIRGDFISLLLSYGHPASSQGTQIDQGYSFRRIIRLATHDCDTFWIHINGPGNWEDRECSRAYFRQQIWDSARMLQQFMMNQVCE